MDLSDVLASSVTPLHFCIPQSPAAYLPRPLPASPPAEDETKKTAALRHVVLYLVLATYDNEQSDLTHRLLQDKTLELIPTYKSVMGTVRGGTGAMCL